MTTYVRTIEKLMQLTAEIDRLGAALGIEQPSPECDPAASVHEMIDQLARHLRRISISIKTKKEHENE
jgi:hypothetical protein